MTNTDFPIVPDFCKMQKESCQQLLESTNNSIMASVKAIENVQDSMKLDIKSLVGDVKTIFRKLDQIILDQDKRNVRLLIVWTLAGTIIGFILEKLLTIIIK